MPVPILDIKVGEVYQYQDSQRRVIRIDNRKVYWRYADGVKRGGKFGNVQQLHYFAEQAEPLNGPVKITYSELEAEVVALKTRIESIGVWDDCEALEAEVAKLRHFETTVKECHALLDEVGISRAEYVTCDDPNCEALLYHRIKHFLLEDNRRLKTAIRWALGITEIEGPDRTGDFYNDEALAVDPLANYTVPRYWWRKLLREKAGL